MENDYNVRDEYWKLASPTSGIFVSRGHVYCYEKSKYFKLVTLPQTKPHCFSVNSVFRVLTSHDVDRVYLMVNTSDGWFLVTSACDDYFTLAFGEWNSAISFHDCKDRVVFSYQTHPNTKSKVCFNCFSFSFFFLTFFFC